MTTCSGGTAGFFFSVAFEHPFKRTKSAKEKSKKGFKNFMVFQYSKKIKGDRVKNTRSPIYQT
jgi:hypothetical protein